jgi:hypothetical protein
MQRPRSRLICSPLPLLCTGGPHAREEEEEEEEEERDREEGRRPLVRMSLLPSRRPTRPCRGHLPTRRRRPPGRMSSCSYPCDRVITVYDEEEEVVVEEEAIGAAHP